MWATCVGCGQLHKGQALQDLAWNGRFHYNLMTSGVHLLCIICNTLLFVVPDPAGTCCRDAAGL